jgi:plasmid stabilization system protein ParE
MPYRVSHGARQDLEEIFEYWATHASSHGADRVLESITDRFWLLGEFPRCGKRVPNSTGGLSCFPAGNYLIYYRWSRRGTDIIHIFHGSRDQSRALKPTRKSPR